jgi:hypothetical protein
MYKYKYKYKYGLTNQEAQNTIRVKEGGSYVRVNMSDVTTRFQVQVTYTSMDGKLISLPPIFTLGGREVTINLPEGASNVGVRAQDSYSGKGCFWGGLELPACLHGSTTHCNPPYICE